MELVLYLIRKDLGTPAEKTGYKNDTDMLSVYSYTPFYSRYFNPALEFLCKIRSPALQRSYFGIL